MKLSRLLRMDCWMSSSKSNIGSSNSTANSKIKQLFGETEFISSVAQRVKMDKVLLSKNRELKEEREKIRNYHYYEYYRGQDLIENIPYPDVFKYTLKDKINEDKDRERRAIEELQPIRNHAERAKLIRERLAAFHDKQRKYQIEEFQKYLSEYPGTVRGPRPEDDWEAYRQYGLKKMPKILLDELKQKQTIEGETKELKVEKDEQISTQPLIQSPSSILTYFGKDRTLTIFKKNKEGIEEEEEEEDTKKDENRGDKNDIFERLMSQYDCQLIDNFQTDVPLMPTSNFENYQYFINHWMNWLNFRNSYVQFNLKANIEKLSERLLKLTKSLDPDPENQYMELDSNIPSLCRYYRCLPKVMQDHPGMKDIYLGLEYTSPDYTYEEKEDAINYTCKFLLPFDDVSKMVMTEYTSRSRVHPTPYMFDKIFTISPEYTWDLKNFMQEIRRQQLKGETSNQNKDQKFPQPPEVHKMWQEGAPNLPVDYYDNDDGFWDTIISQKLRRYDAYKPMLKTRRHFTH